MSSLQDKIEEKNQNGEERTKEPTEKLKSPPPVDRKKKLVRKGTENTTAKDPTNHGQRT